MNKLHKYTGVVQEVYKYGFDVRLYDDLDNLVFDGAFPIKYVISRKSYSLKPGVLLNVSVECELNLLHYVQKYVLDNLVIEFRDDVIWTEEEIERSRKDVERINKVLKWK